MNELEQDFIQKADEMADRLEALAGILRSKARRKSGTCVDRAFEILSVVNSATSNLSHEAMIKRAMMADKAREDE